MKTTILPFLCVCLLAGCSQNRILSLSSNHREPATEVVQPTNAPLEATTFPKRSGHVSDYADVLSETEAQDIESFLEKCKRREKIDISIAVMDDTGGQGIFDYSLKMAREWKVGSENGGILVVIAIRDRKWHIHISRKTEEYLRNDEVRKIGEVMVADLKNEKYATAVRKCVNKLVAELAKKQAFEPETLLPPFD